MSKEEKNKILYEFNDTKTYYPKDKSVIELFEEQVKKHPNDIALIFENEKFNLEVLEGIGIIGECEVKCINASSQVLFHCGYVHRPTDDADVKALCEKFGITIPEEYL